MGTTAGSFAPITASLTAAALSEVADNAHGSAAPRHNAAELMKAVARMSPLPMVLSDPNLPDCPLVFSNQAFRDLTQYDEAEIIGRNCRFLQGEMSDSAALDVLREAIADRRESQVEVWNYRKDGTAFWCSMFVAPVFDRDGQLAYWFGSQLNSSTRREMDEARADTRRIETLGAMAAGIAHEFNNLLTIVVANAEAVRTDPITQRQAERLDRVDLASRAAGRLTHQMLAFAGRQTLSAETVDLSGAVRDLDRLLARAAAPGMVVELELTDTGLPATLDVGQLEAALVNLVRNASDASARGGRITVGTRMAEPHREVEVSVTDEGCGMPPDVADRAAEPFFTTKAHGQGTGLGLSMVSGFMRQSGGRMVVDSEAGRGTTIRLVFPRA